MKINYNGLWKVLIDKNMNKKDLMDRVGISTATVAKMTKGEFVSMQVLYRIFQIVFEQSLVVLSFSIKLNY